ncbi:MAG: hypothetical protein KAH33_04760 [Candidatus Delongbacteria bacterium]|nr:hypothetical protein [Candidatus Delongbacteria bacterium]
MSSSKTVFIIFVIFLVVIIFPSSLFAQIRKPVKKSRLHNSKTFNQIESAIMKADRYEDLSDYGRAYNLYNNLIRTNFKESDVLNGYVRNSVKTKKIKRCEIKLKELISNSKSGSKINEDPLEILLESFLGQLFFMTGREMQGNEIIKMINASNIPSKLKYMIKGRMYYESLNYKNAIELFLQARKELKDNDIFSKELFNSYEADNLIIDATNELVNIFLKEDKNTDKRKKIGIFSAKHEIIKFFEVEENRDKIINVVIERSKKDSDLLHLLSELYFMNKDYDNSFSIMKKIDLKDNELSVIISFAYKLFKDKEYKNSVNFYSLYFTEDKQIDKKELKQYFLYIDALVELDQLENCINELSRLDHQEAKVKLAYIYHLSGNWKRSKNIYEKHFEILRKTPNEFIDYLRLLMSMKDYSGVQKIIKTAMKDASYYSMRRVVEDQLLYLDIILSLLQKNKEDFFTKYRKLTTDKIISDNDNNIIKIKNDLDVIGDDEKLLDSYLDHVSYQVDPTNSYQITPPKTDNIDNKAKKLFVLELNYYYLKASKNSQGQSELIKKILNESPAGSEIGSLIIDHCKNTDINKDEKDEILMSLIKGEFSDIIKSKARKIIRQK